MTATVNSMVFKFPDRSEIGFQCDISICLREDPNCTAVSPPLCGPSRFRRSLQNNPKRDWSLHSQPLSVVDIDSRLQDNELHILNQLMKYGDKLRPPYQIKSYCLSVLAFGAVIAILTFILTVSSGAFISFICLRGWQDYFSKY
ncbi:hypothetical protein AB6A40_000793 [Gnathostoma spinigerum]|uniref:ZP domain-containing protein n=1 Tax=Gnathostoma spinigerum TaxID=75299 RepID=A0ABD6E2S1_9BILA